jgi:hypothetical protein
MTDLATIERTDVELTETAWAPSRELSFEEWQDAGLKLGQIARSTQWWLGDWLNYGINNYGEKYYDAVEQTGYDVQTLMNMASIAKKFEPSRRREILSWSHHETVAKLDPPAADAILEEAEQKEWTRERLRQVVGGSRNGNGATMRPEKQRGSVTGTVMFEQTFENENLKRTTMALLRAEAKRLGFKEKRVEPE